MTIQVSFDPTNRDEIKQVNNIIKALKQPQNEKESTKSATKSAAKPTTKSAAKSAAKAPASKITASDMGKALKDFRDKYGIEAVDNEIMPQLSEFSGQDVTLKTVTQYPDLWVSMLRLMSDYVPSETEEEYEEDNDSNPFL